MGLLGGMFGEAPQPTNFRDLPTETAARLLASRLNAQNQNRLGELRSFAIAHDRPTAGLDGQMALPPGSASPEEPAVARQDSTASGARPFPLLSTLRALQGQGTVSMLGHRIGTDREDEILLIEQHPLDGTTPCSTLSLTSTGDGQYSVTAYKTGGDGEISSRAATERENAALVNGFTTFSDTSDRTHVDLLNAAAPQTIEVLGGREPAQYIAGCLGGCACQGALSAVPQALQIGTGNPGA